jgi:glycosyl-4,4'-diaponeurosporenoate acyltransferase
VFVASGGRDVLIPLSNGWAALVGGTMWAILGVVTGYVMHRMPVGRFDHDTFLTRLRPSEADGRIYERRLAIRRWKRWLPEGGDVFEGGFNKRHLGRRDTSNLQRFVVETRRAEMTHWVVMFYGPLFWLWSSWWMGGVMVVFGVVSNVPCLVTQRYNRARLLRVLRRRSATTPAADA